MWIVTRDSGFGIASSRRRDFASRRKGSTVERKPAGRIFHERQLTGLGLRQGQLARFGAGERELAGGGFGEPELNLRDGLARGFEEIGVMGGSLGGLLERQHRRRRAE